MMAAMTMSRVEQYERRSEVPLLLLAVAFLVAYVWPVLDPELPRDVRTFLEVVSWTIWTAFAIDFAIRIALADRRGSYIVRHWYDVLLVAIPPAPTAAAAATPGLRADPQSNRRRIVGG